jgi:hypothetical protein
MGTWERRNRDYRSTSAFLFSCHVAECSPGRHDPLPDDVAVQLGHRGDDDELRLPHRRRGLQGLLVGHEVDPKCPKLLQRLYQLLDAPRESIESPDHDYIEGTAVSIGHQGVEPRATLVGPLARSE